MTSDFDWWLLLVGIVVGAGLAWLVLAEFGPSAVPDPESEQTELQLEADWIAARFEERGATIDRALLADALELDRLYRRPDIRLAPTRPRTPVGGTAAAEGEEESPSG